MTATARKCPATECTSQIQCRDVEPALYSRSVAPACSHHTVATQRSKTNAGTQPLSGRRDGHDLTAADKAKMEELRALGYLE
jgi:hypothetical protein